MALITLSSPFAANPRVVRTFAAILIGVPLLWAAAYVASVFPWLGYEHRSRSSIMQPPAGVIGESKSGFGLGISNFLFFKGETIVVDYDADIRRGCLWMQVWHIFKDDLGDAADNCVTQSGKGEWTLRVPETGIYEIMIDGSPTRGAGRGWDMDYTVWWGARY